MVCIGFCSQSGLVQILSLLLTSSLTSSLRLSPLMASKGGGGGRGGRQSFVKGRTQKQQPMNEEERREATARAQAGRVSARENKEAEYFWSCVRQQNHALDSAGRAPLQVSLKVSLTEPLGLAFDAEDLRLLEVEGQGRALLKVAAATAAVKAGLPVLDSEEDEDEDSDGEDGEATVPAASWTIKGVGGIAVGDGPEFVKALARIKERGEAHAFVQMVESAPGEVAKLVTAASLFVPPSQPLPGASFGGGESGGGSEVSSEAPLPATAAAAAAAARKPPVVRSGAGSDMAQVPPLTSFLELAPVAAESINAESDSFSLLLASSLDVAGGVGDDVDNVVDDDDDDDNAIDAGVAASETGSAGLLPSFLAQNLVRADRLGFSVPTPIQSHCVPLGMAELDLLACAETGSGKTVAFLLPIIASLAAGKGPTCMGGPARLPKERASKAGRPHCKSRARRSPCRPAALVLAPTRELAQQIERECAKLCFEAPPPLSGASRWCASVYGGAKAKPQLLALAGGVEVLVATPGRLVEFLKSGLVGLDRCTHLVLDEADRMLDMGFERELGMIVGVDSDLPPKQARQTLLFSATFADGPIRRVASEFLREPFALVSVGGAAGVNVAGAGDGYGGAAEEGGEEGGGGGGAWGGVYGSAVVASVAQAVVPVPSGDRRAKLAALVRLLTLQDSGGGDDTGGGGTGGEQQQQQQQQPGLLQIAEERTMVFVERKKDVAWVARQLNGLETFGGSGSLEPLDGQDQDQDQQEEPISSSSGSGGDSSDSSGGKRGALPLPPGAVVVVGGARAGALVCELHGDRTQSQRDSALASFRQGKCKVLVCTDVAGRGLDVANVDHVIQFDLPTKKEDFESYIHRVGRTGRAGLKGRATALFVPPPHTLPPAAYAPATGNRDDDAGDGGGGSGDETAHSSSATVTGHENNGDDEGEDEEVASGESDRAARLFPLVGSEVTKMRVRDIRGSLKERGLNATGKKMELAGRLRQAIEAQGQQTTKNAVDARGGEAGDGGDDDGGGGGDDDAFEVWGRNDMAVWRDLKRTLKLGGHPLPGWFLDLSQHTHRASPSNTKAGTGRGAKYFKSSQGGGERGGAGGKSKAGGGGGDPAKSGKEKKKKWKPNY